MGLFTTSCNHCGHSIAKAASNCNQCGKPTTSAWTWCRKCGVEVGAASQLCHKCASPLQDQPGRLLVGDRLKLPLDWIAARLAIRVPQRTLHHGLQVDNGTRALLKVNGEPCDVLPPKYHLFDSFLDRLPPNNGQSDHIEATLFTTGSISLSTEPVQCRDSNGFNVSVQCRVQASIANAVEFDGQVMLSREYLTTNDLASTVAPAVHLAIADELRDRDVVLLDRDNVPRQQAQRNLTDRLAISLSVFGLNVSEVTFSSLSGASLADLQRQRGENAHLAEKQRLAVETAALKDGAQRNDAQRQHELSEFLKGLGHDSKLSEQERAIILELEGLQGQNRLGDAKSKLRINEMGRKVEELKAEAQLNVARVNHSEDIKDIETARRIKRSEMKVRGALDLGDIALQSAQGSKNLTPGIDPGAKAQRLNNLSQLLRALEDGDMQDITASLNLWSNATTAAAPSAPDVIATPSASDAIRGFRRSVGVVVAIRSTGEVCGLGTAWAVKRPRGIFAATNAHVALAARSEIGKGARIEWRLSGAPLPGIAVDTWYLHPIFEKPGSVICGGPDGNFPSHDVALLKLKNPPLDLFPLPVASDTEIRGLREGIDISSWTCPTEGIVGMDVDAPQAMYQHGNIVALSDYHFKPLRAGATTQIVHHSIPVVGGASGSPIFAVFGTLAKVVAVICSGNFHLGMIRVEPNASRGASTRSTRLPSAAQQNFAQPSSLFNALP